jgi:hypothetical protein
MGSHDAIGTRVETRHTPKDINPDPLLVDLLILTGDVHAAHVQQQLG